MSLGRMKVGKHGESGERRTERGEKERERVSEREREGGKSKEVQERRAKENAAALPANSRRPAIFTRPIK